MISSRRFWPRSRLIGGVAAAQCKGCEVGRQGRTSSMLWKAKGRRQVVDRCVEKRQRAGSAHRQALRGG